MHGPPAHGHRSATEPHWRLWATPESQVLMLPQDVASMDAIELGCGTGYVSSWLVRAGARPVGIDISHQQLATAQAMQAEFGVDFPLVLASLWCDPHRWIPEAAGRVSAPSPGSRARQAAATSPLRSHRPRQLDNCTTAVHLYVDPTVNHQLPREPL